jgi:hypothetical protein
LLIYFLAGELPWQGLQARTKQEKYDKISKKKGETPVEVLCRRQPSAFLPLLCSAALLFFVLCVCEVSLTHLWMDVCVCVSRGVQYFPELLPRVEVRSGARLRLSARPLLQPLSIDGICR